MDSATEVGELFRDEGVVFDTVYTSDTKRAIETAEKVLEASGQDLSTEIISDARVREVSMGIFEGASYIEVFRRVAEELGIPAEEYFADGDSEEAMRSRLEILSCWHEESKHADSLPCVERFSDLTKRFSEFLNEVATASVEDEVDRVLIVSHMISISAFLSQFTDLPPEGPPNSSWSVLEFDGESFKIRDLFREVRSAGSE